ncbi:MAG: guanylate kinase [Pseudomonadales bacterium]
MNDQVASDQDCLGKGELEKGRLFVVAAPSGAGKTSLVKALVDKSANVQVAISHTTRSLRPGETNGVNYFFVKEPDFKSMVDQDEFAEWAEVFGYFYGTSKAEVQRILNSGNHLILEIDWQGAQQIRHAIPQAASIFIVPPSLQALKDRLMERAQDDEVTVQQRMDASADEISHFEEFDYLLVNDSFDEALLDLIRIVNASGDNLRLPNQKERHKQLLSDLLRPANDA